jgi:chloramphenicol 3-O phosphotransferase
VRGTVILLSGTSSSGKSTLARGLQERLGNTFLHLELDAFIRMMADPGDPVLFERMVSGMNRAVAGLAEAGNDLIVDHVLVDNKWLKQLLDLLAEATVYFVGVDCSLPELERREKLRDARRQGFASQQFEAIHRGKIYDILVDTERLSPEECLSVVSRFLASEPPTAFERLRRGYAAHTA